MPPVKPSSIRPILRWLPLVLLLGCTALYTMMLGGMTVVDPETLSRYEESVRSTPLFDSTVRKSFRTHFGTEWYTVRHVIGFFPLGLLLGTLGWVARIREGRRRSWRTGGRYLGAAGLFIVIMEIAQFWIPGRTPHLTDVLAGFGGTLLGFGLAAGVLLLLALVWRGVLVLLAWLGILKRTSGPPGMDQSSNGVPASP